MQTLDLIIIFGYLIGITAFGILFSGKQETTEDYFVGDRSVPWWAIAGSTRMRSGTAQKMVPNMISTVKMKELGFFHGNRMTNFRAGNEKLKHRAVRIFMAETGIKERDEAAAMLAGANFSVRDAMNIWRRR